MGSKAAVAVVAVVAVVGEAGVAGGHAEGDTASARAPAEVVADAGVEGPMAVAVLVRCLGDREVEGSVGV